MTPNETIRNLVRILEEFTEFPLAPVSEAAGEDDLAQMESWTIGFDTLKAKAQNAIFEVEERRDPEKQAARPLPEQLSELVQYAREQGYAEAMEAVSLLRQDMEDHGAFVVAPPDTA